MNRRLTREPAPRASAAARLRSQASAEQVDAACTTDEYILRMLTGDFYFHHRIEHALSQAGFVVESLERGKGHGIWLGLIRTGATEISRDHRLASRELRKLLNKSGFRLKAAELGVYERRKDMVSFSLIFPFGRIGALT